MDWKPPLVVTLAGFAALSMGQEAPRPTASALVSKVLAYYSGAQSMVGTIRFTQTAQSRSVVVETNLQFERPSKLYIRQELIAGERMLWLVVSNGTEFSYNTPENLPGATNLPRLIESVSQNGLTLDVPKIYKAAASSIGDRSAPLDIAIGHPEDLKSLTFQWATLESRGRVRLGEEEVDLVAGRWRPYGSAPASGQYEMYISPTGELRRYVVLESVSPQGANGAVLEIRSVWDVRLKVGAAVNQALFKIIR
jgi:outer membrane lipoprotein-sorting protein